jgi:hypothetical protein
LASKGSLSRLAMHHGKSLFVLCLSAVAVVATGATAFRATPHAALAPRGGAAAPPPKKAAGGAKKSKAAAPAPSKGLLGCSLSLDKACIVKLHGMIGLVFISCWALETFGVPSVPAIGLQATVKGISMDDPVTKFLVRLFCSLAAGLSLAEIEPSTNPYMQKIYPLYQIPFALSAIAGAREFADGPFGYALASILGIFLVLGIVA